MNVDFNATAGEGPPSSRVSATERGTAERSQRRRPPPSPDRGQAPRAPVTLSLLSWAPQMGGVARYTLELVRALAAAAPGALELTALCNEHALARLSALFPQPDDPRAPALRRPLGYRVGSGRATRGLALMGSALLPQRLNRAALFGRSAVVHYPLTVPLPRAGGPTVVTLTDTQHHERREQWSRAGLAWRHLAYDRAARRATVVVTISDYSRARIVELLGIDPERIFVAPLGVDHGRFGPGARSGDDKVAQAMGLPARFLVYPAGFWPHKNHARLLEALALLPDRDVALALSGMRTERLDRLQALARRLGVLERVHYLGFLPDRDVPALYRRATALVFPSLYEGFGLPPLEAMACGCPVACSRAGALGEVCGQAALELDPEDPAQMARQIGRLLEEETLRADLAARGLEQAARFTWARCAEVHLQAYAAAAANAG